jgi:ketosteroid isomerase-like protein
VSDSTSPEGRDVIVPEVIQRYFDAHDRGDASAALSAFTAAARVVDDGHDYSGSEAIRHWLAKASTEFTYTRAFVAAEHLGGDTWIVRNHLEGNFPGGEVDLRYQFTLTGGSISELVIAP